MAISRAAAHCGLASGLFEFALEIFRQHHCNIRSITALGRYPEPIDQI
jgi:hypothetical protein